MMASWKVRVPVAGLLLLFLSTCASFGAETELPRYGVHEVSFAGPTCGPTDAPARDVELVTRWRHESSGTTLTIQGFWDGDGKGGVTGNVFKVRFCPTRWAPGRLSKPPRTSPNWMDRTKDAASLASPRIIRASGWWTTSKPADDGTNALMARIRTSLATRCTRSCPNATIPAPVEVTSPTMCGATRNTSRRFASPSREGVIRTRPLSRFSMMQGPTDRRW